MSPSLRSFGVGSLSIQRGKLATPSTPSYSSLLVGHQSVGQSRLGPGLGFGDLEIGTDQGRVVG